MKLKFTTLISVCALLLLTNCFEDRDDNGVFASEINDFVWKAMNAYYLYKPEIENLANDRFTSNEEYGTYLNSYDLPEHLFESLIYDRINVDKYSWITDDYIALEQQFDGVSKHTGLKYGLRLYPDNSNQVYGYARYVLPGTSAESEGIVRGDVFNKVDGVQLFYNSESDNNLGLLNADSFALNFATYNNNGTPEDTSDDTIISTMATANLVKAIYTENPVFKAEVINFAGENVGYLMYNRFTQDFDEQLNNAFGNFVANNVQHLVLDLRYNPGGNIRTASFLGSMITGQFNDQVFAKLQYNENFNDVEYNFENQLDNGATINSLNLDKVYVIATGSSASASEMIINSLRAYLNVNMVHIGSETEGKSQASSTFYDSEDFGRVGANPNHTYALQPLIAITVNKDDGQVPSTGLIPNIMQEEDISNLGILGDVDEPMFARALSEINGADKFFPHIAPVKLIGDDTRFNRFAKELYIRSK